MAGTPNTGMQLETSKWSGDGQFTEALIESMTRLDGIVYLRVEDAPTTRSDTGYQFINNELFVGFRIQYRSERVRRFGFLPVARTIPEKAMTLDSLGAALSALPDVGPSDYGDDGMIQYLRTERVVPPYQSRGYKLVELVRIYEVDVPRE